jgi:hypothetical protein
MKKLVFALLLAVVCCGVFSCNEKPKSYRFVKVTTDGKEEVESIEAKNDTDALYQYFNLLEKTLIANIGKAEVPYKEMFVLSPEGDTLNTNQELLKAFEATLPKMVELPEGDKPKVDTLQVK